METMRKLGRWARKSKQTTKASLCSEINHLAYSGELLPGIAMEIEAITSEGNEHEERVNLEFIVPQEISETVLDTGAIRASSDGPRFTYTFTGALSLDQNVRDFRDFLQSGRLR